MIADVVKLPLSFDAGALRADLDLVRPDEWVAHFNTRVYEGDWSGVALRAPGGLAGTLYPDLTGQHPYADTELLERMPSIAAAVRAFECPLQQVRLLRLGPGAQISEHRDYDLGYEAGEVRVHVPIVTGPGVEFLLEGRRVEMAPGEAWYLDFNKPHAVANRGEQPRVHLILDCEVNPWLDAQLGI